MMDASKQVNFINEKFDEFEVDLKEKKRESAQLKDDLKSLKEHINEVDNTLMGLLFMV